MRRQRNENGMTKQAGRDDDDEGGQDDTTPSNEIGKTSTTPRPPHSRRNRRPQVAHNPPPQGAGDARADKGKHDDPADAITTARQTALGTVHHMTREAENDPEYERTNTRRFPQLTA